MSYEIFFIHYGLAIYKLLKDGKTMMLNVIDVLI